MLGIRLFLPAGNRLEDFHALIALLQEYQFNLVMLEVGGAMEYRRHPEINQGWVEYCRGLRTVSGATYRIQHGIEWMKNSIHVDNAGGGVLSQNCVRDLVAYCRACGMRVVPEVPSLSHSDYLLTAHPELAERREDPYPDTYCPSDPRSYDLLFDVLEEVLDVFGSDAVNIGHDEYFSAGVCERCKNRSAADLFAGDIRKIHEFLARRQVGTWMWGDKLLNAFQQDGTPVGGAKRYCIGATYPAIDHIPSDITIQHWYWRQSPAYEHEFIKRGMPLVFGNFKPAQFPDWTRIHHAPGVGGVLISNWGATELTVLQRNGVLFDAALASRLLLDPAARHLPVAGLWAETFRDLYRRQVSRLARTPSDHTPAGVLELCHTTRLDRPVKVFHDGDFFSPETDHLGDYLVRYANDVTIRVPVWYGHHLTCDRVRWDAPPSATSCAFEPDDRLMGTAWTSCPFQDGSGRTWFRFSMADPLPDVAVTEITFEPRPGLDSPVEWRDVQRHRSRLSPAPA